MTAHQLDDDARARIRAEEAYRAQVREELEAARRLHNRPSYWPGAVLNVLPGAGLKYLGGWAAGLAWLVSAILSSVLTSPVLGLPIGLIGSYLHYDSRYRRQAEWAADAKQAALTRLLFLLFVVLLLMGFLALPTPYR